MSAISRSGGGRLRLGFGPLGLGLRLGGQFRLGQQLRLRLGQFRLRQQFRLGLGQLRLRSSSGSAHRRLFRRRPSGCRPLGHNLRRGEDFDLVDTRHRRGSRVDREWPPHRGPAVPPRRLPGYRASPAGPPAFWSPVSWPPAAGRFLLPCGGTLGGGAGSGSSSSASSAATAAASASSSAARSSSKYSSNARFVGVGAPAAPGAASSPSSAATNSGSSSLRRRSPAARSINCTGGASSGSPS